MHWIKRHQQAIQLYVIFLFAYIFLLSFVTTLPISFDTFWHLQMGLDILNGISPWQDHYSFTHKNHEITSVPLLFQISLAFLVKSFGLKYGATVYFIFTLSLFTWLLLKLCKKLQVPWYVLLLTIPTLLYYFKLRFVLRPELLSYSLILASLLLSLHAHKYFTTKSVIAISLLLLFWVNWHTPIFGYIVFFGLYIDKLYSKVYKKDNSFTWLFWFSSGLFIFLIGFLNLELTHFFFSMLQFDNQWKNYIDEYRSIFILNYISPQIFLLWVISVLLLIWFITQKKFGFAFITIFLAIESSLMARLIAPSGIIISCLLIFSLSQSVHFFKTYSISRYLKYSIYALWGLLSILGIHHAINSFDQNITKKFLQPKEHLFAYELTNYLKNNYSGGKIFNTYEIGGFLLNQLPSSFQHYIDGRTNILYPIEFYKRFLIASNNSPALAHEIKRYSIDFAFFKIDPKVFFTIENTGMLQLDFIGKNYFLFTRNKSNFPYITKLGLFPMCWKEEYKSFVFKEINQNKLIQLSNYPTMSGLATVLTDVYKAKNKMAYFKKLQLPNKLSDRAKRLVAYAAYKTSAYEDAIRFFYTQKKLETKDMLLIADAAIKTKKYKAAEKMLLYVLSNKGTLEKQADLNQYEQSVIITLLESLKKHISLKQTTSELLTIMKNNFLKQYPDINIPLNNILADEGCKILFDRNKNSSGYNF